MRRLILFISISCIFVISGCSVLRYIDTHDYPNTTLLNDKTEPSYVIDNVHIIDVVTGNIRYNQQLEIQHGVIAEIRPAGTKTHLQTREGNGYFVSPGLFDMHVHIHDRTELIGNLAYGVTTVRNLRGMPMHLRWREEVRRGDWLGADMFTASPILNGNDSADILQKAVTSPSHGRELVRAYKQMGYDSVKLYGYLDDESLVAMLDEAKKINMPVAKHGPHAGPNLPLLVLLGVESLEHVEDVFQGPLNYTFDVELLDKYVNELISLDPYFTPTLATFDHLVQLSEHKQAFIDGLSLRHLNPTFSAINYHFAVQRWLHADQKLIDWNKQERDFLLDVTRYLEQVGINLLVGSDAGTMYMQAGLSTHREMQLMQQAGISPHSILRSATYYPAKALSKQDALGTIEIGKLATLVFTQANPLDDIAALETPSVVIKNGIWLDKAALENLDHLATRHSGHWVSSWRIWEDVWARWRS